MNFKLPFTDETKDAIIAEQEAQGYRLYEEQRHYDGMFLLFTDEPYVEPQPPLSTHISTIDAVDTTKARPVRIKRVWEGEDYFYDCLATESVKDQYIAGDVKVGDFVIVHFDDIGEQIVVAKVFKSWE